MMTLQGGAVAIVPRPARMEVGPGAFVIAPATAILVKSHDADVTDVGDCLAKWLRDATGYALPVRALSEGESLDGSIVLATTDDLAGQAAYQLVVEPRRVSLSAPQAGGLFHGVQTIRQLMSPNGGDGGRLPCLRISDSPRYRWRGMLLDCCRHFMDKEFVKRIIDLLAYHKMNVLHWHLTEDQGWRIEIKKYPRLTDVGAWRGTGDERYGGFYTQEDIREIVAYAASRFITVVPEIEMPGHSTAALVAYPEFSCTGGPFEIKFGAGIFEDVYCAGNERTFEFLQDVLSEVMELFPSEYIHVGGDECPKTRWKDCPKCQARIQIEGLKDEHELQSYFIRRMEKFLNSKGRRLIGWDEILEGGLAPNATVQSWRGMSGALTAARAGHDVISSPTSHCYLDYSQGWHLGEPTWMGSCDLKTAYSFEPTPPELTPEQAERVLGAECNLWTEYAPQDCVDRRVFPRLCALAEAMWTPADERNWGDFAGRMETHYRRLDGLGVRYYVPPPRFVVGQTEFVRRAGVELINPGGRGEMRYTDDGTEPNDASPRYEKPLTLTATTTVKARVFCTGGNCSDLAEMTFVRTDST